MEPFNLTIDGREVEGFPGETVLEIALRNDIDIPNLCHDARLAPAGACRLCVVEAEGFRGLQPSCTLAAAPGMTVRTQTDEIRDLRKLILELLVSEHRMDCATCDADGACKLQRYVYQYQVDLHAFPPPVFEGPPSYTDGHPTIAYDPTKCIRCGRCVRICDEVQRAHAITLRSRAAQVQVSTAFDVPLAETPCETCGQCISACPTGALREKEAQGLGQARDLETVRTTCPYCGVGCQIDLQVNPKTGRIVRATSETGTVPNDGNLCVKGRFGLDFVHAPDRLTAPLLRDGDDFRDVSWEEALDTTAEKLAAIRDEHGPDAIAFFTSAKATNEDNFVLQKFARAVIGTNNVDHCARL